MRRSGWQLIALTSVFWAVVASAATRPQYGGTLRVATHIAPASLDPADTREPDSIARRNLIALIFDTLVVMDDTGNTQPGLATSWQAKSGNQRWQFFLRKDVEFQDGSPLRADAVAASLRANNAGWTVYPSGNSVILECSTPEPDLPAELALSRNAIAKRTPLGTIFGTGPFREADWQPGKRLTLAAQETYWGGRPFLDTIVIEMGRSSRDQLTAFDLGKLDVIELGPEHVRRFSMESRPIAVSAPIELLALFFSRPPSSTDESKQRQALALSIDRAALKNVIFQGEGEIAGGVLPDWMSGYEFIFPSTLDLARARQLTAETPQNAAWSLSYDSVDPLAHVVAERIALNARDAGINLKVPSSQSADVRLVRVGLPSVNARLALSAAAAGLSIPATTGSNSIDDMFKAESALLQTQRVIPLLHLPSSAYAIAPQVKNFAVDRGGEWRLTDVWLVTGP
jgi:peptide/nickel transport system substrate-binding protein